MKRKSSDILKAGRARLVKYGWCIGDNGCRRADRNKCHCVAIHVLHAEGRYDRKGYLTDYPPFAVYRVNDNGTIKTKDGALRWIDKAIEMAEAAGD